MEIRKATIEDAAAIANFNVALAQESENVTLDPATVRSGVEAVLRDAAKGSYFGAYEGKNLLGVLLVTYEWSDWRNGNFWWLQSVYVDKDCRARGVFKALLAHVSATALETPGVCGFRLYVDDHNVQAQGVYQRLNFKRTDYQLLEKLFDRPPPNHSRTFNR